MLIVMDAAAAPEDVRRVVETVNGLGLQAHPIPGAQRTAIGVTGNKGSVEPGVFENLPGVLEVIPVSAPYKLVSREAKRETTVDGLAFERTAEVLKALEKQCSIAPGGSGGA